MKRFIIILSITALWLGFGLQIAKASTSDHKQFDILKQKFKTGPDVTAACLTCHTEAAKQIQHTIHWNWESDETQDPKIGKTISINNFCISLQSNEPRCTSCHAGYGWEDKSFDFTIEKNVDCLVCHDQTGTYEKFPTDAGHPAYVEKTFGGKKYIPPDLSYVAQNIGLPSRTNCGSCHFYGGGGEGVKHADLDMSLANPSKSLDVHMDAEGLNFSCVDCHTTKNHEISGRYYSKPATETREFSLPLKDSDKIYCESCHSMSPHKNNKKLNDHTDKVACQTCHIPHASREKPTKSSWDWSKAGEFDENGKEITRKDSLGNVTYMTKKGEFTWSKMLVPEYVWFNGSSSNVLATDIIDDRKPVQINTLHGSYDDSTARIFPVKVHRGKQVYDPINKTLVIPKLFGPKGSGAYWKDFDWTKSVQTGMDYVGLPFSGEVGFVETEMYWPITHMVAPAEDALTCVDCHATNGRLANLSGFYMPGRDRSPLNDLLGWLAVALTLFAVIVHGSMRFVFSRKRKRRQEESDDETTKESSND